MYYKTILVTQIWYESSNLIVNTLCRCVSVCVCIEFCGDVYRLYNLYHDLNHLPMYSQKFRDFLKTDKLLRKPNKSSTEWERLRHAWACWGQMPEQSLKQDKTHTDSLSSFNFRIKLWLWLSTTQKQNNIKTLAYLSSDFFFFYWVCRKERLYPGTWRCCPSE